MNVDGPPDATEDDSYFLQGEVRPQLRVGLGEDDVTIKE